MIKSFLVTILLLISIGSFAQFNLGFQEDPGLLPIKVENIFLGSAGVGGFSNPQFSEIDLNQDEALDMFVFDHAHDVVRTFLYDTQEEQFFYAPEYESDFPDELEEFALLRDYDCDGKADIFTYYEAGFRVFRNTSSAGDLSFEKVTDKVRSDYGSFVTAAFVLSGDIPALVDVDYDGDLDMLTFGTVNSENTIEYHRNLSQDLYGHCDSLTFEVVTQCWGNVEEPFNASNLVTTNCKGVVPPNGERDEIHPGSSVLLIDTDGDDDKDLIVGDIQTNRVVRAINEGDAQLATIDVSQQTDEFPNGADPVRMQYLVAGYEVDVDHDGIKDLVMSVNNSIDSSVNTQHTWYYKNYSGNGTFYLLAQEDFLLEDQLDLGSNTTIEVADLTGDGRPDLLVANDYRRTPETNTKSRLYLFEQLQDGSFDLVDENVGGLSAFGFSGVQFTLGDLDDDGDQDLLLGDADGNMHYFENNPSSGAAVFTLSAPQYMGINTIGSNASPTLGDLNDDGLLDLVVGDRTGELAYFQNEGTETSASFTATPTIAPFGEIDVSEFCCGGYASPRIIENNAFGVGKFLVLGSDEKRIDIYEIPDDLEAEFTKVEELRINSGRITPSISDFDQDGILELICGTAEGGLKTFDRDKNVLVGKANKRLYANLDFQLYPNPVKDQVTLRFTTPYSGAWEIIDVSGRSISSGRIEQRIQATIDVQSLQPGSYFIALKASGFNKTQPFLILR